MCTSHDYEWKKKINFIVVAAAIELISSICHFSSCVCVCVSVSDADDAFVASAVRIMVRSQRRIVNLPIENTKKKTTVVAVDDVHHNKLMK